MLVHCQHVIILTKIIKFVYLADLCFSVSCQSKMNTNIRDVSFFTRRGGGGVSEDFMGGHAFFSEPKKGGGTFFSRV